MSAAAPSSPARRAPFSVAAVAWLVGVGVFCTLALIVLGAYAPELRDGNDGQGHALSRSGTGFAGTAQLLGETGFDVRMSRGPVGYDAEGGLLLLTPPPGRPMTLPVGATLVDERLVDTVLIVLPKWTTTTHPRRPGWVETRGVLPPAMVLASLPDDLADGLHLTQTADAEGDVAALTLRQVHGRPSTVRGIRNLQALSGGDGAWSPVMTDAAGRMILAMHTETGTYVLADPDLLNTAGIADLETARAADAMLHSIWYGDGPVLFDLTAWGFAAPRSVLRLALEPPLLGATLCLLAAVALTGWQAAIRFGPHRRGERAIALGKQALADNTAGLIRLGRRERAMAAPYADLVRARAARRVGAPRGLDAEKTDALLARLPGSDIDYPVARDRMEAARDAAALTAAARDLHRWKNETTHGRR